jgi:hypothetical protein
MPEAEKRIVIPKTLQERMLGFFLKAEAQRKTAKSDEEINPPAKPQNPVENDDRS